MRQIVLDTETTGLEPEQGHRIIEIGCVELVDRRPTGRNFHQYLQPDREIDSRAEEVHGISNAFLADKPRFGDVVEDLLAYLEGAELVIHNAPFDTGFVNAELARLDGAWGRLEDHCTVLDTLALARRMHPGQRNSLDALCTRYRIDNSRRDKHGALLDSELLAEVYLELMGGRQPDLTLAVAVRGETRGSAEWMVPPRPRPLAPRLTEGEALAHARMVESLGPEALWLKD